MGSLAADFCVVRRERLTMIKAQVLLLLSAVILHSDCALQIKRNINALSLPVGSRALYDDIVRRINSPQEQATAPSFSNLGLALFNSDQASPVIKTPPVIDQIQTQVSVPAQTIASAAPVIPNAPEARVYAVPEASIYAALAAQEEASYLNSLRADQQLRALEHEAFVAHEYQYRVEVPEHVEERGRFYNHESIANSFRPVQRKPSIVIGASDSRI